MAEQPVNLSTVLHLGGSVEPNNESSKPSSRRLRKVAANVLLNSQCPARDLNTGTTTTGNGIIQAVAIGLMEKTERRCYCAVYLPNILTYRKQ
jgi:hypothetical protein